MLNPRRNIYSVCLVILFVVLLGHAQEERTVLTPNQLVTFSLTPGQEKVFILQMKKGDFAKIESLVGEGVELTSRMFDPTRKELLLSPWPCIDAVEFAAQTEGEFFFVTGLAKDQHPNFSGAQRITVRYSKHLKLPIGTDLRIDSINVPISLAVLVGKLGRNYFTCDDTISGNYYIWKFQNGLQISAPSVTSDVEPFEEIIIASESSGPIANCPFGFVLNQTTFNQVKSRFGSKLRPFPRGYKVYSTGRWNHFYFKNKRLVEITLATFEVDKVR